NYRYASMMGTIRRQELKPAVGELPSYGHVINMFSAVYDKGSKVFGMIEERLGEAAFRDFTRLLQKKYAYRILTGVELRQEVGASTGKPWGEFCDHWIYGRGVTDWSVDRVCIRRTSFGDVDETDEDAEHPAVHHPHKGYRVRVILRQRSEITEQTVVGFAF